jgi:hypothetical protein
MSLQEIVAEHLFNDATKKAIIDGLNKSIDIPLLNERTEEKILTAIYDVVEDVMREVLGAK